jgi:murein DD-endopeptidase MepM/ murein hydrolase activator NlpD
MRLDYPLYEEAPVLQGFGDNALIYARFGLKGHNGWDLGVYAGTPVLAMADGIVRFAGDGFDEPLMGSAAGNCVLLDHGDYLTGYAHLLRPYGESGIEVKADVIGLSGATGAVSGDHLHLELIGVPLELSNGYMGRISPLPFFKRGTPLYTAPSRKKAPL